MPLNKNAIIRYMYLDQLLSDRYNKYTCRDLFMKVNERLELDGFPTIGGDPSDYERYILSGKRVIQQDILAMQDSPFNMEIDSSEKLFGAPVYRYCDQTRTLFSKPLSDEEKRKLYDQLKHDLIIPLEDGDIDAANAASLSNKLLQMANGAVYDENKEARTIHSRKLEMLEDLIEAANGQPVLIGYWFKHDRTRIMEHLTACGYVPRDIKDSDDITDWNAGKIAVALIHPASAGHGLNIQSGGHILIWFGLTWSLELYQQTNARLWRQGQQNTVTIHHIVTKDTIDEDVLKALASKDVTQEKLIAAVKARL